MFELLCHYDRRMYSSVAGLPSPCEVEHHAAGVAIQVSDHYTAAALFQVIRLPTCKPSRMFTYAFIQNSCSGFDPCGVVKISRNGWGPRITHTVHFVTDGRLKYRIIFSQGNHTFFRAKGRFVDNVSSTVNVITLPHLTPYFCSPF